MKILLLLQLFVSLVLATDRDQQNQQYGSDRHPEWRESVSQSQLDFAVRIFQQISSPVERPPPNLIISPISIYTTLSMLALGASGKTVEEILFGLGLNNTETDMVLHEGNRKILQEIHQQTKDLDFKLGKEVFMEKQGSFQPEFQVSLADYYNASIHNISFSDPQTAQNTINNIVSENTDDKIKNLVSDLDSKTSMVVLDYAVFQGKWKYGFSPQNTEMGNFTVKKGNSVLVPMMHRWGLFRTYKDTEMDCNVVEVPYIGNISLLVIVPQLDDLYHVQQSLTPQRIKQYIRSVRISIVSLYLPKVTFTHPVNLKHYLMVMGMENMFSKDANFIQFSRDQKLKVSNVYHQSYINIKENGAEASSATDARLDFVLPSPFFKVDRPYLMLIYHKITETILWFGRVMDPSLQDP